MKKSLIIASLLAAIAATGSASANTLSHNYLEAGYSHSTVDASADTSGVGITGSWAINRSFQAIGGFAVADGDEYGMEHEIKNWHLGLGYAYPIGSAAELHVRAYYDHSENDVKVADFVGIGTLNATAEAQSTVAEIGLRRSFNSRFEGWVYAGFTKMDSFKLKDVSLDGETIGYEGKLLTTVSDDESTYGRIGGLFKITRTWGVGGEVKADNDFTTYTVGVRASF